MCILCINEALQVRYSIFCLLVISKCVYKSINTFDLIGRETIHCKQMLTIKIFGKVNSLNGIAPLWLKRL